jgi:hypothetical protein
MLKKDLYLDCLQNKISSVSHYIYHLLEEKKLSVDDDSSKLDSVTADLKKIDEMVKNDVLGIYKTLIYQRNGDSTGVCNKPIKCARTIQKLGGAWHIFVGLAAKAIQHTYVSSQYKNTYSGSFSFFNSSTLATISAAF